MVGLFGHEGPADHEGLSDVRVRWVGLPGGSSESPFHCTGELVHHEGLLEEADVLPVVELPDQVVGGVPGHEEHGYVGPSLLHRAGDVRARRPVRGAFA